jgi:hypothetical protein
MADSEKSAGNICELMTRDLATGNSCNPDKQHRRPTVTHGDVVPEG